MRLAFACPLALMAVIALAQTQPNPGDLYQSSRERVLQEIDRLPRYTCVQTITRHTYRNPLAKKSMDCEHILRNQQSQHLALVDWDRLRVDVAIVGQQEVYSWVGASRFEETDLSKMVDSGQTTMGDFGSLVLSIFRDHPTMHFDGERKMNGRPLLAFSYQTSENESHYLLRIGFAKFITAYSGSVFVDAGTGDLVRVTALSAVLPEQTGYCQVGKQLDYARLRIGGADTLIPSEATSTAVDRDDDEMSSSSTYSSCREYVGESVLRFDDAVATDPNSVASIPAAASAAPREIPPGLPFECRIVSTIDSDTAAAGDPIEAVLRTPITDPSGKVWAPTGTRIRGRLMGFSQHPSSLNRREAYEVQVQLRSLELAGGLVPFAADVTNSTVSSRGVPIRLNLHPDAGMFIFYDKKLHIANFDSKWVTAARPAEPKPAP